MINTQGLIDERLVFINFEASSQNEVFDRLGKELIRCGYVKETFINAIKERENIFPTGLDTGAVKVAIPHTDPEHVLKPTIAVAKLKEPVLFREMGSDTKKLEVSLVFMLAVSNPADQLETLSKLMSIFSDEKVLLDFYNETSQMKLVEKINKIINSQGVV